MPLLKDFSKFLKTFGIVGLALAFVIGQASNGVVNALVIDIVNPFIGLFLPAGTIYTLSFSITNMWGNTQKFMYGDLISNMISFTIIAFLLFLAYKFLSRLKLVEDKTKV
jgi:large conductance mechanosensitive channel